MPVVVGEVGGGSASSQPTELEGAELIDSIVARVNRHPITRSQLDLEARLALAQHGDVFEASAPLSGSALASALDYLVDQILLDDEANHLQVFDLSEEDLRAEVTKLSGHFPSAQAYQAFLDEFSITPDTVQSTLRRALRAERYLDDKIRVQVQGGSDVYTARALAKEVVNQLRSRADIRIIGGLTRLPPTGRHDRAPAAVPMPSAHAVARP